LNDVFGYGIKYLFGTGDAQDVKRLSAVCDELHTFKSRVTHASEHQMTYIRTLDEGIKQNAEGIVGLAEALRENVYGLSLVVNIVEANLLDNQAIFERQTRYCAAIREIEMAIPGVKFDLVQLQEALDVTSNGKLSSMLIHPYNLSVILQQVVCSYTRNFRVLRCTYCTCCCYLSKYWVPYRHTTESCR
jgi:predicted ATPase